MHFHEQDTEKTHAFLPVISSGIDAIAKLNALINTTNIMVVAFLEPVGYVRIIEVRPCYGESNFLFVVYEDTGVKNVTQKVPRFTRFEMYLGV